MDQDGREIEARGGMAAMPERSAISSSACTSAGRSLFEPPHAAMALIRSWGLAAFGWLMPSARAQDRARQRPLWGRSMRQDG
ncbi:hypothetical protein GCM10017083_41580 [Thalassobaculum fulvum]|uniref:Uncharacterized protein n=1 Tax=Thalassobaculum fulvum TaxID=1633335 RepID=A0A919CSM1_9PROT|nr:hypothetical protein GCM10017083_41580 [Thalassobaculum fulvum]